MIEAAINLKEAGYRFVFRHYGTREYGPYVWVHPLALEPDDVDLTDLDDCEFERWVRNAATGLYYAVQSKRKDCL